MKTFRKVTSLALALALVLTSAFAMVSFAAETFNDVPSNHQYAKAISSLVDEGVLQGYENDDGSFSFKPENTVTRAEFATIIARASTGEVPELTTAAAQFADMGTAEISWAVRYVSYAVGRGVINGFPADENGAVMFKPNDPVTYGQAIKMIVCMLGYGNSVVQDPTAAWYQGYLDIANQLSVTKGAAAYGDDAAPRGMVAQLVYNMLDTKPQVQTGIDQNGNPVYSASDKNFREETLQTQTYTGQLLGVFNDTIKDGGYGLSRTELLVGDEIFELGSLTADSLKRYLGYEVKVTYTEDSERTANIAKTVSPTNRNEIYTVNDSDIDMVTASYLEYWKSPDDKKVTKLNYNKNNLVIIQNGSPIGVGLTDNQLIDLFDVDTGNIEFIDSNGDGSMDVAFVTSYETYVINQKNDNKGVYSFYDKFGMTPGGLALTLDNDSDDVTVKMASSTNGNLTNSTVSAIAVNDVISVAKSMSSDKVEVIISRTKQTGAVNELDSTGNKVTIGKNEYKYSQYYIDIMENNADQRLTTSDNVTAYLDFMGKIAYVNRTAGKENYGYVMKAGRGKGMDAALQVEFIDSNGKIQQKEADTSININGKKCDAADALEELAKAAAVVGSNASSSDTIWGSEGAGAEYSSLMRYELNNSGKLKTIYLVDGEMGNASGVGYRYLASGSTGKLTYSSSGTAFKSDGKTQFTINSNTKVFIVPFNRDNDKSYVVRTGTSYFTNNKSYYIDAYEGENASAPAKYVVVYAEDASLSIDGTAKAVIVDGWSQTGPADDPYYNLRYYEVGTAADSSDLKTMRTEDADVLDDANVKVGDVIRFAASGSQIEKIEVLFSADTLRKLTGEDVGNDMYNGKVCEVWQSHDEDEKYFRALYGTVVVSPVESQGDSTMLITRDIYDGEALDHDAEESYSIDNDSVKVYIVDPTANNDIDRVEFAGTAAISSSTVAGDENASRVLVVTTEKRNHNIIIFK